MGMADNNWKHKEGTATKCKRKLQDLISKPFPKSPMQPTKREYKEPSPKHRKNLKYTTNQLSKTQGETGNTYHGHHLKTGNDSESLINKPHQAGSNQKLKEEMADKFREADKFEKANKLGKAENEKADKFKENDKLK